jgi:tetratricopeptide (TPR) repeat protein
MRIASVRLVARPRWPLNWLADRLADERRRLDELAVGDLAVRASVAISYRNLRPAEQRALRLLGLLDLPDFCAWVAAALLDMPVAEAETVLERLLDAQLLEAAGIDAGGRARYRFHDLLRLYARERGVAEEAPAERDAALRRALGAYLYLAERAEAGLPGGIRGIARAAAERWPVEDETAAALLADPLGWFAAERASLPAAVARARELALGTLAWGLAGAMSAFFELRAHYDEWRRVQRLACLAARQAGDRRGEAHALRSLGDVDLEQGRAASAAGHLEAALRHFGALGDRQGEAWALRGLGIARHGQGRLDEAVTSLERSLALFTDLGDQQGEAYATFSLGIARHEQGRLDEAVTSLERSLALFTDLGDQQGEAYAVRGLGRAYQALGRLDEAAGCFDRCLLAFRELADARGEALAILSLGEVDRGQGRLDSSADRYQRARGAFSRIGDRFGEALALHALGELYQHQGRSGEALACFEESLATFRELGVSLWEATTLRRMGYASGGEPAVGGMETGGPPPAPPSQGP